MILLGQFGIDCCCLCLWIDTMTTLVRWLGIASWHNTSVTRVEQHVVFPIRKEEGMPSQRTLDRNLPHLKCYKKPLIPRCWGLKISATSSLVSAQFLISDSQFLYQNIPQPSQCSSPASPSSLWPVLLLLYLRLRLPPWDSAPSKLETLFPYVRSHGPIIKLTEANPLQECAGDKCRVDGKD